MAKWLHPTFIAGQTSNILPAIQAGIVKYPAYVFCADTNTLVFVDKNAEIQNIRGYQQESIIYVDALPTQNIRKDAFYFCDGIGYLYIDSDFVPVFHSVEGGGVESYNDLSDIPIINKSGSVGNSVILSELDSGSYNVTGQYQITSDDTVYITAKNVLFLVDSDVNNTYVTKFGTGEIVRYTVNLETGEILTDKYVTEQWIEEQGYTTQDYVDQAISDLYDKILDEITVVTKVSELENDAGYLTKDDFDSIGDDFISGLFD